MKKGVIGGVVTASIITGLLCIASGGIAMGRWVQKKLEVEQENTEKYHSLFIMMNNWMRLLQEGKSLTTYFENNNYKRIAIYGMSFVADRLISDLSTSSVQIVYGIDQNITGDLSGIKIVSMNDEMEKVDAIVVTPITYFSEIAEKLRETCDCAVISIEDIIDEL